jgi:hypothetical protein
MERDRNFVIATDIDNFWSTYDLVKQESDTLKQIESLYVQKGSIGLAKIMNGRDYSAGEYVELINKKPGNDAI